MVLSIMLTCACSDEPASPGSDPPAADTDDAPTPPSDSLPPPPADPAAAFQNVADTLVRVMNADDRMQGELTVVEATIQPNAEPTQPDAAVGTIVLAYQSTDVDPPFACKVTLPMENAGEYWGLITRNRMMSDYECRLTGNAFNSHVRQQTDLIRSVMDDLLFKREISNALNVPKP